MNTPQAYKIWFYNAIIIVFWFQWTRQLEFIYKVESFDNFVTDGETHETIIFNAILVYGIDFYKC